MRCHLMSLGCKIWNYVEKGYRILDNLPTNRDELDEYESNAKYLNAILKEIADSVFVKVCNVRQSNMLGKNKKLLMKGLPKSKNPNFKHTKGSSKV